MSSNEDLEVCKELYEYSSKQFSQINESKRHLENKCMNILQASAILITLFLGLMQYLSSIELKEPFNTIYKVLQIIFYISIITTVVIIILSLNDSIEHIRIKLLSKLRRGCKTENVDIKDAGKYLSLPEIKDTQTALEDRGLKCFYNSLIESYHKSIKSLQLIILTKHCLFLISLKTFVFSIFLLVVMGILIA